MGVKVCAKLPNNNQAKSVETESATSLDIAKAFRIFTSRLVNKAPKIIM